VVIAVIAVIMVIMVIVKTACVQDALQQPSAQRFHLWILCRIFCENRQSFSY
jgi:hypothetical protein